jgi:pimeloyl-ACP methyl ester carboxylesterase
VEKFQRWSDCGGNIESVFSKDDLLTNVMIYWVTGAINSSFWPYYARHHEPWPFPPDERITVPTAHAAFPRDIVRQPRAWAERAFDLRRWTDMPVGGHFAAFEQPDLLAADLREFFRTLRPGRRPTR